MMVLFFVKIRRQQQVGKTQNPVHRGSDFMAHVREKTGLGTVGAFGRFLGGSQLLFGLLARRDVQLNNHESDDFAIVSLLRCYLRMYPAFRHSGCANPEFRLEAAALLRLESPQFEQLIAIIVMYVPRKVSAGRIAAC